MLTVRLTVRLTGECAPSPNVGIFKCSAVAAVAKQVVFGRISRRSAQQSGLIRCKSVSKSVQSVRIGAGVLLQVSCSVLRSAGESPRWSGSGGAFFFSWAVVPRASLALHSSLFALCSITFSLASSKLRALPVWSPFLASSWLRASSETVEPVPVSIAAACITDIG